MTSQTTKEEKEIQDTKQSDGYVSETNKQNLIFESEEGELWKIDKNPLQVSRVGNEWFVVLGTYRLTEALGSREEAFEDAERKDIERIYQLIDVITEIKK